MIVESICSTCSKHFRRTQIFRNIQKLLTFAKRKDFLANMCINLFIFAKSLLNHLSSKYR